MPQTSLLGYITSRRHILAGAPRRNDSLPLPPILEAFFCLMHSQPVIDSNDACDEAPTIPPTLLHPPGTLPKIALLLAAQLFICPDLIKAGVAQ